MRRSGGYALITSPTPSKLYLDGFRCEQIGEGTYEVDTFTCKHCSRVVHVPARGRGDDYFCRNCMAPICPPCANHPCVPFLRKIETWEARDRMRREL